MYRSVAGLDIHQKMLVACVRQLGEDGRVREETRTYLTMTRHLQELATWLSQCGVTHVAMESTGVYWKPIWNVLEGQFSLLLVNARELKQVPGRKSDVRDCQWIAHLAQCGLLRSSLVFSREQRELRDLTRHRVQLIGEASRVANRIHKLLQDANIKLASVASDVLGKSGRAMLEALLAGERDPERLAKLARASLRGKIPQLTLALQGCFNDHHAFWLQRLLHHHDALEDQIHQFDLRIGTILDAMVPAETFARLDQVPGVNRRTIEAVIAEIGLDMRVFPTAEHLCSWTGICPANEESAGKRRRVAITPGNRWLRRALTEAAWAASHAKDTYFYACYRRLAARRGRKRALVAVARRLLVVLYHMLRERTPYHELGAAYFDRLDPERTKNRLVCRLRYLGYDVELSRKEANP
jgi:transposase